MTISLKRAEDHHSPGGPAPAATPSGHGVAAPAVPARFPAGTAGRPGALPSSPVTVSVPGHLGLLYGDGGGEWRAAAACLSADPELFFPVGNTGPAIEQEAEAKAICRRCPVRAQCLSWALEHGEDDGVWGGLSASERRDMRRREVA